MNIDSRTRSIRMTPRRQLFFDKLFFSALENHGREIIPPTHNKCNKEVYWSKNDTIQERSNSNFDVKCATIQFYGNNHNSQSDRWIELNVYLESPDMLSYIGLIFQVNQSLGRHRNTGQQRLYEFCYLLPFNLWTSYLARILFLKGCGSWFWKSPSSTKIFNGLQHSFHVWQGFINVQNPFLTRIPYSS